MAENEVYIVKERFKIGKSNRVYRKNESGATTGEYDGYYNPKTGTVSLYPAKGSWIYGKLQKEQIAVNLIKLST
jgi:hypothetical protein